MSRFFSKKYASLTPYTPGEQPKGSALLKLNTNESPFSVSENVREAVFDAAKRIHLYCDPECTALKAAFSERFPLKADQALFVNGSDEALNFAFAAFCDEDHPAVFPDITYGFYPVFCGLQRVPFVEIPLADDFSVNVNDYLPPAFEERFGADVHPTIFLANPNAPTSLALKKDEIEMIVKENPDSVVVVDEAYVDFGAESVIGLIDAYENLLVVQTFSKSRSLAGARLGMAMGNASLIADLNTLKYASNPYNVNALTQAAGAAMLKEENTTKEHIRVIKENRAYLSEKMTALGFEVLDSSSNFIFARHSAIAGDLLAQKLREKGVLVRHFSLERIKDFNRITIGTREQMDVLLEKCNEILEEQNEKR